MIDSFKLTGKTCFVAGANGRIGQPLCHALAQLGARVIACDQADQDCSGFIHTLPQVASEPHLALQVDATDEAAVREAIPTDETIDGFVHCIGLTSHASLDGYVAPVAQQSLSAWRSAIEANLTSAFILSQALEPALRKSDAASIVFVGSIYAELGPDNSLYQETDMANPIAYGASKGGLLQLMRYLATQWAPDIRVNSVSPGGIEANQPASFKGRYADRTPLNRMATPNDIAGPIAFLLSDAARYVTGHNLIADGGWSAW
ncbi:MAG: hypothetical protein CBD18_05305 [Opitutales bacterium TMED158]|nr:MAG: hypothetical protein CBD18_05305 [Opitutales bacterium TMED158]